MRLAPLALTAFLGWLAFGRGGAATTTVSAQRVSTNKRLSQGAKKPKTTKTAAKKKATKKKQTA